jgi:hypothetical protein
MTIVMRDEIADGGAHREPSLIDPRRDAKGIGHLHVTFL